MRVYVFESLIFPHASLIYHGILMTVDTGIRHGSALYVASRLIDQQTLDWIANNGGVNVRLMG